jgi:hypothetical protein
MGKSVDTGIWECSETKKDSKPNRSACCAARCGGIPVAVENILIPNFIDFPFE